MRRSWVEVVEHLGVGEWGRRAVDDRQGRATEMSFPPILDPWISTAAMTRVDHNNDYILIHRLPSFLTSRRITPHPKSTRNPTSVLANRHSTLDTLRDDNRQRSRPGHHPHPLRDRIHRTSSCFFSHFPCDRTGRLILHLVFRSDVD